MGDIQQRTKRNHRCFKIQPPIVHLLGRWPILDCAEASHGWVIVGLALWVSGLCWVFRSPYDDKGAESESEQRRRAQSF